MSKDTRFAVLYILLGLMFAVAPLIGTMTNQLVWLTALIFLGLGIYRLAKSHKK